MSKKKERKLFLGFFGATIVPSNFKEIVIETHKIGFRKKKKMLRFWLYCNDNSCHPTDLYINDGGYVYDIEAFNNCLKLLHESGVPLDYTKFQVLNGDIG